MLCIFIILFFSEYTKFVLEALELEDTIKNYDRRDSTGWFALKPTFVFLFVIVSIYPLIFLTVGNVYGFSVTGGGFYFFYFFVRRGKGPIFMIAFALIIYGFSPKQKVLNLFIYLFL